MQSGLELNFYFYSITPQFLPVSAHSDFGSQSFLEGASYSASYYGFTPSLQFLSSPSWLTTIKSLPLVVIVWILF